MPKKLILLCVLLLALGGWSILWADQSATDQAENIVPSPGLKAPGDILWHCDVQTAPNDNQILGVETLRDTIYTTGGNNGVDPNYVYAWLRTGSACQYLYSVNQPAASTGWGWRDLAADADYLYSSYGTVLNCFYVTPAGVTLVPANNVTFAPLNPIRAVAYDPVNNWFWGANFSSNIYAFNRLGVQQASYANTKAIYGLAYDNVTPGGPYLWCHVQDSCNIHQFSLTTGTYTGVVYSGWGDDDPGVSGLAGGLCVLEGNPSKQGALTLLALSQCAPVDELYAMEIYVTPTEACCLFDGSCVDVTPGECQTLGGTPQGPGTSCATVICPEWPNHKMHFPQLPDLIGWDVNATMPLILADDWQCSQTGWVTDIHFWGSWKDLDSNPYTDDFFTPAPMFLLSIHENIPASADTPYSRPGRQVWGWAGEILGVPSDPPTMESWFDPVTGFTNCNDHVPYWRYDFFVANAYPQADSFFQYEGQIYWLNVSAVNIQPPYQWGWKNTTDHFMDDAVFSTNGPAGPWYPIVEPPRCNWFDVLFNSSGHAQDYGSTNYYGQGWYRYEYWTNMWFYDNPFTFERPKHIHLNFNIEPVGPGAYAEFAINWSTPAWDSLGMDRPPLPGENEMLYIGRQIFPVFPGPNTIDYMIPYNPEWVSVDFMATNVMINGWIYHECVGTSLDLAFVITGHEGAPPAKCGDVNNDGVIDVGDVVYLINYLFKGGLAPVPLRCVGDVNNDDVVDIGDVVYLINYLFKSGIAPSPLCCTPPWLK